jgi:hypothetical protein
VLGSLQKVGPVGLGYEDSRARLDTEQHVLIREEREKGICGEER